jgi:Family of unknown function (DUF1028)
MRAGKSAPEVLQELLDADKGREARQVAMIGTQGRVMAHTGKKTTPAAGHIVGKDYAVQANLMRDHTVWPAMANALRPPRAIWPSASWRRSKQDKRRAETSEVSNQPHWSSSPASQRDARGLIECLI